MVKWINHPLRKLTVNSSLIAMSWIPLQNENQLDEIIERSKKAELPLAIYKHSTRCGVSTSAKMFIENSQAFKDGNFEIYYLDLLANRSLSDKIAEVFEVQHESPQLLFIKNGECVYDVSHHNVSGRSFKKVMNFI